jgi:NAD(P)-dependent dehydrogenase (short-subunit alcohol dehydrogenase family)
MAVNVRGPFLMAKYVVPHMRARRYGKIINIGSGTVFRGIPQMVHYVTSKGAVSAFTRSLSRAVGTDGICVNTLAPGFTLSDSVVENNPTHVRSSRDNAIQRRAIKRDAHPPDLIGALIPGRHPTAISSPGNHRGRRRRGEYVIVIAAERFRGVLRESGQTAQLRSALQQAL